MLELAARSRAYRALRRVGAAHGLDCASRTDGCWRWPLKDNFDLFLTGDRNLAFQQNTTQFRIAIVVLEAEGVQLHHTLPLMPKVLALLPKLQPGQVVRVRP